MGFKLPSFDSPAPSTRNSTIISPSSPPPEHGPNNTAANEVIDNERLVSCLAIEIIVDGLTPNAIWQRYYAIIESYEPYEHQNNFNDRWHALWSRPDEWARQARQAEERLACMQFSDVWYSVQQRVSRMLLSEARRGGLNTAAERRQRSQQIEAEEWLAFRDLSRGLRAEIGRLEMAPGVLGHAYTPSAVTLRVFSASGTLFSMEETIMSDEEESGSEVPCLGERMYVVRQDSFWTVE